MVFFVFYTAAGYQSFVERESCYRMHDGVTAPTWALVDASDPTKGVTLTYTNGDWCDAGGVESFVFLSLIFYFRLLLPNEFFCFVASVKPLCAILVRFSVVVVLCVKPLFSFFI